MIQSLTWFDDFFAVVVVDTFFAFFFLLLLLSSLFYYHHYYYYYYCYHFTLSYRMIRPSIIANVAGYDLNFFYCLVFLQVQARPKVGGFYLLTT